MNKTLDVDVKGQAMSIHDSPRRRNQNPKLLARECLDEVQVKEMDCFIDQMNTFREQLETGRGSTGRSYDNKKGSKMAYEVVNAFSKQTIIKKKQ